MQTTLSILRIPAFFLLFFGTMTSIAQVAAPMRLRCEYQERPLGIDVLSPRLSWQMMSNSRNARQTAYQIMVASTEDNLKKDNADVWNSGKVMSDQNLWVLYKGKTLESRKRYFWKVKVWDEKSKNSTYSETAWWEMGILKAEEWQARWIGKKGTEGKPPKAVELTKEFNLGKRATRARLYVTGLGAYHLIFNGKKVGNDFLTPGWTNYLKTLHYQTYDITEAVNQGANFITATLGSGWWASGLGWNENGGNRYSEGPNRLLFQLVLDFYDGSSMTVVSDNTWKVRLSPIVENTLYHGEKYDAQLEYARDWANADILDDVTNRPYLFGKDAKDKVNQTELDTLFSTKNIKLAASLAPQVQVLEESQPIAITEPKRGRYVFDFGQNLVGYVRLRVEGKAGKEITMKFAELLKPDGTADQANLRRAKSTDVYVLKGYGTEEWEPKFTYHGFRYVEVTGLPSKPDTKTLTAKIIYSEAKQTGNFACSEELINKIQKNISWGQKSNMTSVPTDCPQRDERLGWMGDAQIFGPTACYNRDMSGFFAKWLRDITDSQHPTGYVYDVNPKIVVDGPSKPAWGDALTILPMTLYQFYGDKRIIEENYEASKRWVNYMNNHKSTQTTGLYFFGDDKWNGYGDWVPVEKSPTKPIGALYQVFSNRLVSEMATILGKTTESQQYRDLAQGFADKYNKQYFRATINSYDGGTQTINLLPVSLGITSPEARAAVIGTVAENVKAKNNHLTTGFLGTGYLLPRLSDYGHHELAYKVATQRTYPSWGYMIDKGATSMWELWNSDTEKPEGMNSRNHFAYGSVGEWFYGYLAGIRPDTKQVGFKRSIIAPKPAEGLTWAEASYESSYGLIKTRWENTNGKFTLNVEIPANTNAEVHLPTMGKAKPVLKEGGKVQKLKTTPVNNEIVLEIGSGKYVFEVE
jgi:alpha-L-rhamnosidase